MINLFVLDIETTLSDEVIEVYAKNLLTEKELHIFVKCKTLPFYYDRNCEYYDNATYISKQQAKKEMNNFFNEVAGKKVILGYNSNSFDRPHIKRMIDLSDFYFLDAYHYLTKKINFPIYSYSLDIICEHFEIKNYSHTAKEDCNNLLNVIKNIAIQYPDKIKLFECSCVPDHRIGKGNIYGKYDIGLSIQSYLLNI